MNEEREILREPTFRVSVKENTKHEWFGEVVVRSDSIEDLKSKFNEAKDFVVSELKKLNG